MKPHETVTAKPRMKPTDRKASILDAAVATAAKLGFANLRLAHVATAAECSNSLIISHFSTMTKLRRAVMRRAIDTSNLAIIAQGVAIGDPTAAKITPTLRRAALATLNA